MIGFWLKFTLLTIKLTCRLILSKIEFAAVGRSSIGANTHQI